MRAELIDHMGTDLTVVNAARVSFEKESDWETAWEVEASPVLTLSSKDEKLISYLAKHNHWTPFAHAQITLRETVPIFVARQRFKHTVGFSYNEVSRRYVDSTPEFYRPESWRKRAENKKQGSLDEAVEHGPHMIDFGLALHYADKAYRSLLAAGVCPEQARMVLPQSMMTSYYVTGSLAAFARAYSLRIDPHSQVEIQLLAKEWDRLIAPLFPVSWKALTNG